MNNADRNWHIAYIAVKTVKVIIDSVGFMFVLLLALYSLWGLYEPISGVIEERIVPAEQISFEEEENGFDALIEKYSDLVAYLSLDDTLIADPVVQANDNEKYLTLDPEGNPNVAGSLFLDFRNDSEFSDFYSLIYGHHMRNKSRFGQLSDFLDEDFFNQHTSGKLITENTEFVLDIFAAVLTNAFNSDFYTPMGINTEKDKTNLLEKIKKGAFFYRDTEFSEDDQLLGMSTCYNENANGRLIIFARMIKNK